MKKRTVRSWTCALHAPSVGEYSVHHSTVTPAVTPRFGRDSYYCLATVLLLPRYSPTATPYGAHLERVEHEARVGEHLVGFRALGPVAHLVGGAPRQSVALSSGVAAGRDAVPGKAGAATCSVSLRHARASTGCTHLVLRLVGDDRVGQVAHRLVTRLLRALLRLLLGVDQR